jgi:hypothetical protein
MQGVIIKAGLQSVANLLPQTILHNLVNPPLRRGHPAPFQLLTRQVLFRLSLRVSSIIFTTHQRVGKAVYVSFAKLECQALTKPAMPL